MRLVALRSPDVTVDKGASFNDYLAMVLVVAAIVGVVAAVGGFSQDVLAGAKYSICKVAQDTDCIPPDASGGSSQSGPNGTNENAGLDRDGYFEQQCVALRLDCDDWDPERGLSCNDDYIVKTYEHYADLYRDHPELHWAGMANLAGDLIYAGMQDLHVIRKLNKDARENLLRDLLPTMPGPVLNALASASEAELEYFENKFANMQKQVFRDLGWQHDAYANGGIEEMRRLDREGDLPPGLIDAWEDIASGDEDRIKRGNEALLAREQTVVLQDDYDDMKGRNGLIGLGVTYMLGLTAESPVPGGKPFREVANTRYGTPEQVCTPWGWCQDIPSVGVKVPKNIADHDSRWQWISEDMLPQYQRLLDERGRNRINREIDRPILERSQDYRLIPLPYNSKDGVC